MRNPKQMFATQRAGAKRRGIEWRLTFEEWLAWWGDDLANRGRGRELLQMQRIGDVGPYALDNIRKGRPSDNGRTASMSIANRRSARRHREHQARLDAMMWLPSAPPPDDDRDRDERPVGEASHRMGINTSGDFETVFVGNGERGKQKA